jgi:2-methylcitrate dehydratase PrpD
LIFDGGEVMNTDGVAEFICGTTFADIPYDAITAAKQLILDYCGVAIAGSKEPAARIVSEYVKNVGARSEAGIIGQGFRSEASLAALANGTAGHALDYDDHSIKSSQHPTVTILPGILSLGEAISASGKAILEAYIVGIEVATKIGVAIGPLHYENGWHTTGTLGAIGAAAGAAKLLKLSHHKVRTSLGIVSSLAGGLRQNFGTMTKPLHAGRAAYNGVFAVTLADREFSAAIDSLEGRYGFSKVLGRTNDIDINAINLQLGSPFFLTNPGVDLKLYPSCGSTLCAIDAALYLANQYNITPNDIVRIELNMHPMIQDIASHHKPQTGAQAKFSVEYCVSRAFIDRKISLTHFTQKSVIEPDVQRLIEKVRYDDTEKDRDKEYTTAIRLTVHLKDGQTYSKRVEAPRGDVVNALTADELYSKFMDCASSVLTVANANKIAGLVSDLDHSDNIDELMGLLTFV